MSPRKRPDDHVKDLERKLDDTAAGVRNNREAITRLIELVENRLGAPKEPKEPLRPRLRSPHEVTAPPDTPLERTFTGTFIGRRRPLRPPEEDPEDTEEPPK